VLDLLHAAAPRLALPDPLAGRLAELAGAGRRRVHVQLLELHRVDDVLADAGVPHLFFKGPALAALTTGDAAGRGPGDLDVLVPPALAGRAHAALGTAGWLPRPGAPEPGTWAWRWLDRIYGAQALAGGAVGLDLHWRLDATLDGLPDFAALWERRAVVDLGGRRVPTLAARDALAHSCLHAAKDEWRWVRSLVDVHRLARSADLVERPPARLEVTTLAVTEAVVGLPAGLPGAVRARVARVDDRAVARALRAQHLVGAEAGGSGGRWLTRYQLAASASPRDLRRLAAALVLPARDLDGLPPVDGRRALPHAVGRRLRRLVGARSTPPVAAR
jgi:hypothetical protein